MRVKRLAAWFVFCLCLLTAGGAFAQNTKNTVKFTSRYSDLDKDCRTIRGTNGTDDASDCRGVGGYKVNVSTAAAAVSISAYTPKTEEAIPLAMQDLSFDQTKVKLEWRMADGKPFAVIMRVAVYADRTKDEEYFGKKTGEKLIVKGLKGYEDIDFEVDAKTPNANAKAREMADEAYGKKLRNLDDRVKTSVP